MDMKKKIILLVGSIVAVVLVCVLLVGMLNGFWLPNEETGATGTSTGIQTDAQTGDTDGSEETVLPGTTGTGETTGKGTNEGGSTVSGETTDPTETEDPSEATNPVDIEIPIETTEATEETEPADISIGVDDGSTESSGNGGSFEIDFDDLLG